MLPHTLPPVRLAMGFSQRPTALASPYFVEQVDWSKLPPNADGSIVDKGCTFAAVSRNPLCAIARPYFMGETFSYNGTRVANKRWKYIAYFTSHDGLELQDFQVGPLIDAAMTAPIIIPMNPQVFVDDNHGDSTFAHPHGRNYYAHDYAGRKCLHATCALDTPTRVTFSGLYEYWTVNVFMKSVNGWQVSDSHEVPQNGSVATMFLTETGFYAFEIVTIIHSGAVQLNNLTMSFENGEYLGGALPSSPVYVLGFGCLPDFDLMEVNVQVGRVLGASVMHTQDSAVLQKGGRCAAYQLPPDMMIHQVFGNPVTQLANKPGAIQLPYEKGVFGFHVPTKVSDVDLSDITIVSTSGIIAGYNNPLMPPSGWAVVGVSVSTTDVLNPYDGTAPGAIGHATYSFGFEFATSTTWLDARLPRVSPAQTTAALEELGALAGTGQQFHENPLHISEIMQSLRRFTGRALRLAPTLARVMTGLIPGFTVARGLPMALSALGAFL